MTGKEAYEDLQQEAMEMGEEPFIDWNDLPEDTKKAFNFRWDRILDRALESFYEVVEREFPNRLQA